MNTHIQKLAQEAGLYVDVNGKPWPRNMNGEDIEGAYQKFAELIVQECVQHALDFNTNIQSLPDKVMRANLYRVLDYIKDRMELNNE